LAADMMARVSEIKRKHPTRSADVDRIEDELRALMEAIRGELANLSEDRDRKLMTVYLINMVHRAADRILADWA
jgi:hypothetical protein